MHAVHAGYTVIARLCEGRAAQVSALLCEMRADPSRLPFAASTTTHFASGTVLPAQQWNDEPLPAALLLATSFCGPSELHDTELVRVAGAGLRELFAACEGFPPDASDDDVVRFLRAHRHGDTFFSGMQGLTPLDVRRHDELRTEIQTFLDEHEGFTDPLATRRAIQAHVRRQPAFAWASESFAPGEGADEALHGRTYRVAKIGGGYLGLLLLGTLLVPLVDRTALDVAVACGWLGVIGTLFTMFALLAGVRLAETKQTYVACRPPDAHVRALAATQCQPVINEMTIAGPIKAGYVRPIVLRLVLWVVARAAEGIPRLAKAIKIPTVATARWIAADRGRRLIFISNFTNAAEPYVRDFIDIRTGAMRINVTFGFGDGYPLTNWILGGGAVTNPNCFIDVVHTHQRATELWYCPYAHLSIDNIRRNREIREGLFGEMSETATQAWLHLL